MSVTSKKEGAVAKPAPKSTGSPKRDEKSSGMSKQQRSIRLTAGAITVLEKVKAKKMQHGMSQEAFVSKAIRKYGKEVLGDAFPALPDSQAEYAAERLEYLERVVSKVAWDAMCEADLGRAKNVRRRVAETAHTPFSRNFKELNKLRKAGGKDPVDDIDWTTAAFAEKFEFPLPEEE